MKDNRLNNDMKCYMLKLKQILIFLAFIMIADHSKASVIDDVTICAQLKTIPDRVTCYDKIAMKIGVHKTQTQHTKTENKWVVKSEISKIDDSVNAYVYLDAENIVKSWNKTSLYVDWDMYLGLDSLNVLTRLGKTKATNKEWLISTDSKASFYNGNVIMYIKELMNHNSMLLQITPHGESPVSAEFDIRGLSVAIKAVRESCKW